MPRSSTVFSPASQGTQKLFQTLLANSEQFGQKQYSGGIHSGLNLDFIFSQTVCPSLQGRKPYNLCSGIHKNIALTHSAGRAIPATPPSRWSTVTVSICPCGSQAIPVYGNLNVLSVGLNPQHPLPKTGSCRSHFCHQGFRSGGDNIEQQAFTSAVVVLPGLVLGTRLLCRNTSFSMQVAVLQHGPTTYYSLQSLCCMPVIN